MELNSIYKKTQLHRVVSSDLNANMLSHCYLLSGTDEVLLYEYALLLVKEIYCDGADAPCEECNNCKKVNHGNMVDLLVYPKGEKGLLVDDINEIVSDCVIRPVEAKYKVYMLKNFDDCTIQAQNKILKTLEEPPQNVVFVLTTANINLVLPTICSRAKKIDVSPLSRGDLLKVLEEKKVLDANNIASISGGNLSTALTLSGSKDSSVIIDQVFDTLIGLNSSSDVLKYSSKIVTLKKNIPLFLSLVVRVLRDSLVDEKYRDFVGRTAEFLEIKRRYNAKCISKISSHISDMGLRLEFNCNINGLIDEMLLKILEVRYLCQ